MAVTLPISPRIWGHIENGGATAHDQTGTTSPGYVMADQMRCYYSFDTSGIQDKAECLSAVFSSSIKSTSSAAGCDIEEYGLRAYYRHNAIGDALDSSDWWVGTGTTWGAIATYEEAPTKTPLTLAASAPDTAVNKSGYTDLEIRGASTYSGCANGPIFELGHAGQPWLTVTYRLKQGILNRLGGFKPWPGNLCLIALAFEASGDAIVGAAFRPREVSLW